MLDIKLLREEPDRVKKGIAAKKSDPGLVDEFLHFDGEWRRLTKEIDGKRAEQKKLSEKRDIEGGKKNKDAIKKIETQIEELETGRMTVWQKIPNLPSDDTPVGKGEEDNKVISKNGNPPKFDFKPKDHLELGESLGIIDVERAAKVVGSRFGYIKGELVLLQFALMQYAMEMLTNQKVLESIADGIRPGYSSKPFILVLPPVMIRPDVFQRMARLDPKDERYYLEQDDLYLVGSAEHTLGPLHMDETIPEEQFPIRYVGFSTAFRRESGTYGKDTRGILRVHQFDKLEMESFTLPEDSRTEQDFIVAIQENMMWALELPYQVVQICTGDMGGPDHRQIDIETWMPGQPGSTGSGQGKYRETHTSDLNTDYQARRLGTRVKRKDGTTEFVHMNDATAFAGRTLIAILENYQTSDGRIHVPKILQKYMGKRTIG